MQASSFGNQTSFHGFREALEQEKMKSQFDQKNKSTVENMFV